MNMLATKRLLERINLDVSFEELAGQLTRDYGLGSSSSFKPLPVGYEEVNSLLVTNKGKFIVKIFSKDKDLKTIKSNITALLEYYKGGVPVPKLYPNSKNRYLYKINQVHAAYLIVTDYFDGEKFTEVQPTIEDKIKITKILSQIHKLNFKTSANYDIWLTIHLAKEFEKKYKYLSEENRELINPILDEFVKIDLSKFTKSIVHFDLHRENVMKNKNGDYCILDLASTDYNYKVIDLATYMALFCTEFNKAPKNNLHIYRTILKEYEKNNSLNDYEKGALLILIKATFASNLFIPEFLQKTGRDENPTQTIYYKFMGKKGLEMLKLTKRF